MQLPSTETLEEEHELVPVEPFENKVRKKIFFLRFFKDKILINSRHLLDWKSGNGHKRVSINNHRTRRCAKGQHLPHRYSGSFLSTYGFTTNPSISDMDLFIKTYKLPIFIETKQNVMTLTQRCIGLSQEIRGSLQVIDRETRSAAPSLPENVLRMRVYRVSFCNNSNCSHFRSH